MWEIFTNGAEPYDIQNITDGDGVKKFLLEGKRLQQSADQDFSDCHYEVMKKLWDFKKKIRFSSGISLRF
jgi:hypothetical protein